MHTHTLTPLQDVAACNQYFIDAFGGAFTDSLYKAFTNDPASWNPSSPQFKTNTAGVTGSFLNVHTQQDTYVNLPQTTNFHSHVQSLGLQAELSTELVGEHFNVLYNGCLRAKVCA